MTKLYISADLEGAAWVTSPRQCDAGRDTEAYNHACRELAEEVTVVAEAALETGVSAIVVNDAHFTMTNLRPDHLPPEVSLLSGKPKNCAMAAGLDDSFDGAIYIGYHAMAGTERGILNHTFHDRLFDVSINGRSYGEGGINALYASLAHQVPVVLASGDQAFCDEIRDLLPGVETVRTKTSLTATAALSRPKTELFADYRETVRRVLDNRTNWGKSLLTLTPPYELVMTYTHTMACDVAMTLPWLERLDGRRVRYVTDNFEALYRAMQSAYAILGYGTYF